MDSNPLLDVAERVKQQRLDSEISSIKKDIKSIMEMRDTMNFIEVTIRHGNGTLGKVSINPH